MYLTNINDELFANVRIAKQNLATAQAEFQRARKEPAGPNEQQKVADAAGAQTIAMNALAASLKQLNRALSNSSIQITIPEARRDDLLD